MFAGNVKNSVGLFQSLDSTISENEWNMTKLPLRVKTVVRVVFGTSWYGTKHGLTDIAANQDNIRRMLRFSS